MSDLLQRGDDATFETLVHVGMRVIRRLQSACHLRGLDDVSHGKVRCTSLPSPTGLRRAPGMAHGGG